MIVGTSHFLNFGEAVRYYKAYGFDKDAVVAKLADGEIHIGYPAWAKAPCRVIEGRYHIVEE